MSIDWFFPSSNGGTYDGFHDAGIETFTGARYDGLAREIIQNSLDAAVDSESKVTVEFDLIKLPRTDFPGANKLLKTMTKCQKENKDDKGKAFFKNAIQELEKEEITCLKISDFGTTGLRGDYRERKGQWHAITKGRGVSAEKKETAGGSFGIGKNAPFTVSSLRTVFYSTFYEDDNNNSVYRAQGKSILMSHPIGDNEYTQATGFYGESKECMPIEGNTCGDIPEILCPQEQGCVVLIPGFVAERWWREKITATVVSNFFCAINQGKLEVLIQDENDIAMIDITQLDKCFQEIEDSEKENNSRHYYQAMQSPDLPRDAELPLLGHCKMWVLMGEGLPKQVALLRKTGMLITDNQPGLKRWTGRVDFAGVFMCDSDKGNRLLRMMENPQHNVFEPERADYGQRDECKRALKELVKWVRKCVDELAKPEETEVTQIDELSEFFPDIAPAETIAGDEGERDIEGHPLYSPKPLKRAKPKATNTEEDEGDEGGARESDGDGNGDSPSNGTGHGSGVGGTGSRSSAQSVDLKNVRVVSSSPDGKNKTVYFTPMQNGAIEISLAIMGDDGGAEKISVTKENGISDGILSVNARRGERVSLKVILKDSVTDSIVVRAFQKKEGDSIDETVAE